MSTYFIRDLDFSSEAKIMPIKPVGIVIDARNGAILSTHKKDTNTTP